MHLTMVVMSLKLLLQAVTFLPLSRNTAMLFLAVIRNCRRMPALAWEGGGVEDKRGGCEREGVDKRE